MPDDSKSGIFSPVRNPNMFKSEQPSLPLKVVNIELAKLKQFADHPFKLYEGPQLEDLIHSIKQSGVITPIVVRPSENGDYEILAGHNRVHASEMVGLNTIPTIIRSDISDEEATIIVVESNFNQRSIKEMKPSELAKSLYMLNEAMKKTPGYRSDLADAETCSQSDNGLRTMCIIGEKYGFSQAKVARYIRVAQLLPELLDCLDGKKINMGVAENLSYLRPSEQKIVHQLLENGTKINVSQAQALKKESSDHELSKDEISQIISPQAPVPRRKAIKIREDIFAKYFTEAETPEEIEDTIARALELFRQQNPMGQQQV